MPENFCFELDYSSDQKVLVHATSELFNEHVQLLECTVDPSIHAFSGEKEMLLNCAKKLATSVLKNYNLKFATVDMNSPAKIYESIAELESMLQKF